MARKAGNEGEALRLALDFIGELERWGNHFLPKNGIDFDARRAEILAPLDGVAPTAAETSVTE